MIYGIVYCARNRINGKVYVGQTTKSLRHRMVCHLKDSRSNKLSCRKFHLAIKKYGEENFEWVELTSCQTKEELNLAEIKYIAIFKSVDDAHGYSLQSGGNSGGRLSEETKRILSEKSKGEKSVWFGRKHTEESKKRISLAQKGKIGKPHTEESKAKLRQKMMGNCISAEARAKIVAKKTGFRHTEESKLKMSLGKKKNYNDSEYKEKMRQFALQRASDPAMRERIAQSKGAKRFSVWKDDVFVGEFFSIHGASRELGLSCAGIRKALKGKSCCKGYTFRYKEEGIK